MRTIYRAGSILTTMLLLSSQLLSQNISEGFENTVPPPGWAVIAYTPATNGWNQYSFDKHSGNYSVACFVNNSPTNSWLYSTAISLQAGKSYELKYWVKRGAEAVFKVTLNTAQEYNSVFKILRTSFPNAINSFVEFKDTITAETSGTFYLGFQNASPANSDGSIKIDDLDFTLLNQPSCTVVNAGTVSSSVSATCANTNFALSVTGATSNTEGIRYAWQKSIDNINWSNITNGFTFQSSITINQNAATWYRLADTCIQNGSNAVSNSILVNMTPYMSCYCVPTGVGCQSIYLSNITILNSSINNTSTCTPGYTNFSAVGVASTYRGQPISIQHTLVNSSNYAYLIGIWIDADHSGTFDPSEFTLSALHTFNTAITQAIVPPTALTGETRIRIRLRQANNPGTTILPTESCVGTPFGEIEDYRINILGDPPVCTGPVNAGTITGPSQICPNTGFLLTSSNATTNQSGMRYAWQRSVDNVNWTNFSNTSLLLTQITTSQSANSFYRLVDTCTATGQSSISNVISISTNNIFNCYCIPTQPINCTNITIDSVSFNTIQNASGCGAGGYTSYNITTSLTNASVTPIYIRFKPSATQKYVSVWIDFSRNGAFEPAEQVFVSTTTGNFVLGYVIIPHNAVAGDLAMRIIAQTSSLFGTCGVFSTSGEIEDYKINLSTPNPVSAYFSYYVKSGATGLNNGQSWANAFTSLTSALALATKYDTIKVAKGTYTPGTTNTSLFTLKDSIIILGGYPNTGNPGNAERNPGSQQTIISGEIGSATLTDNIRSLVAGSSIKGFVLDGFIIEKAYANNSSTSGPISFVSSTGTLRNVVIRNNYNNSGANSMYLQGSAITLENVFVENNSGDWSTSIGSAFRLTASSSLNVVNTVIAKNKAKYLFNLHNSASTLINTTVFKNHGFSTIHDTSSLVVKNSIFYGNGYNYLADTNEVEYDVYSTVDFAHSITQASYNGSSNFNGSLPKFTDTLNVAGADNLYFNNDDGLRVLNPCSPAINIGDNNAVANIPTDISGAIRIKNGIVDLGAYEVQEAVTTMPAVVYVNKLATGANNGTSWQNAYTDLQKAFQACSDSIKIAKGVYPVSSSDPFASFVLTNSRVVMGGFPDTGNPTNADFNPELNVTVLDGLMTGSEKVLTVLVSNNNTSSAKLIGVSIANASEPNFQPGSRSAAIRVRNKSAAIFEKVKASSSTNGANTMLLIDQSSTPLFYQCAFFTNFVYPGIGGERSIDIARNSYPIFRKTYVGKDTTIVISNASNTGIRLYDASMFVDSCTFYKAGNHAISVRGGVAVIQHSTFTKNQGRSITSDHGELRVTDCIFNDTVYNMEQHGGTLGNINNTTALFSKCLFDKSYSSYSAAVAYNNVSNVVFENSVFSNSYGTQTGAGVFLTTGGSIKLINCIAYNFRVNENSCCSGGSFMGSGNNASTSIINTTILASSGNSSVINSGASSSLKVYNSIIWRTGQGSFPENRENVIVTENNNSMAACDIRNSLLYNQKNTLFVNTKIGIDPKFIDLSNPLGVDMQLYSADDGLNLCTCSPGINTGDNTLIASGQDFLATNRIFGNTVDIGAYEIPAGPSSNKSFYVNANAAPNGNGLSWATAYNNLQKAILNKCADTIRVAGGVYKPATVARDSSFVINSGQTVFGSYPPTGNPADADRNINLHPSILSGNLGVQTDSTDNSYSVMRISCPDTSVIVDGFIFERGTANGNGGFNSGGGVYALRNKNLRINNCIFRNNYASNGGGLAVAISSFNVNKSIFTNNTSDFNGGAFHIQDAYAVINELPWSPNSGITNSVVANNKGTAGVFRGGSAPTGLAVPFSLENVVFYKNEGAQSAGLRLIDNPSVRISNCAFISNNSTAFQPGIAILVINPFYTLDLYTYVYNSVFRNNTVLGSPSSYLNNDYNWSNGNSQQETIPFWNLQYSANSNSQTGSGPGNTSGTFELQDINNGPGPDNLWMTTDDGVAPAPCSPTIDAGSNQFSNLSTDIRDSARIANNRVDMGPYESKTFTVKITAVDSVTCPNTNVVFTANVSNAGANPFYQWQVNGVNAGSNAATFSTTSLVNNDLVRVKVKRQDCSTNDTVISNVIKMRIGTTANPVVHITASDTTICAGSTVTFTAVASGANPATTYQWKVNGVNVGTNSSTFISNSFANNDVVNVQVLVNNPCINNPLISSNSQTIHVNPLLTPSVTITSSANPACEQNIITYTAIAVNGGITPAFQWKVNGVNVGANAPTFASSGIHNNDVITVVMTSSITCPSAAQVTSNAITQQVNAPASPNITISATQMTCPGTPITFTANVANSGTFTSYSWKVNGITIAGAATNTFTSTTLAENDIVQVLVTSNLACVVQPGTAAITVHYTASIVASVSIATSQTTICSGTAATFTATPVNGGVSPNYQWKVNGVNAGTNNATFITNSLTNNAVVSVVMTSSMPCASPANAVSNLITMTVNSTVLPAVSISGTTTVTQGGSSVISTAIINGGSTPVYTWEDSTSTHTWQTINGANGATLNYSPAVSGDRVRSHLTSSATCASPATVVSNTLVFTVNVVTAVNPVSASNSGIRYFPNPAHDVLYIDSLRLSDRWNTLQVVTIDGRIQRSVSLVGLKVAKLTLTGLAAGPYTAILYRATGQPVFFMFVKF